MSFFRLSFFLTLSMLCSCCVRVLSKYSVFLSCAVHVSVFYLSPSRTCGMSPVLPTSCRCNMLSSRTGSVPSLECVQCVQCMWLWVLVFPLHKKQCVSAPQSYQLSLLSIFICHSYVFQVKYSTPTHQTRPRLPALTVTTLKTW